MLLWGGPLCAWEEAHHPLLPTQVIGHSNFGTIRSTTCVYKGEIMLRHGLGSWQGVRGPRPETGGSLCFPAGSDMTLSREMDLRGAHLLPGAHADWLVHNQLPLQSGGTGGEGPLPGRPCPQRASAGLREPPSLVGSVQDPHLDCPLEEDCVPPHPRTPQPQNSPLAFPQCVSPLQ